MSRPPGSHDPDFQFSSHSVSVESLLAAIVDSSDDAIFSKDRNMVVTTWNRGAERIYGWTAEEVIGGPISIIIPEHRKGEERKILDQILAGENVDHYETERVKKDGNLIDVSLTVSPIRDREGTIVGASVIARDITIRRKQERLEWEIERRDFIARAAHELKNPLTTIAGLAQVLKEHDAELSTEERNKAFASLMRQTERSNLLITDVLRLARLESSQVELEIQTVDVARCVNGAIEAALLEDHLSIANEVDASVQVEADPFRLEEVFVNLFSNAAKYGASAATVTARPSASSVEIVVEDDGPGISKDLLPVVFDPFTRGGDRDVVGTGLGLSIVKGLVEAVGGDVICETEAPAGARFVITLPPAALRG